MSSSAVRVSALCAFGITGAVIGYAMLVGHQPVAQGGITDHRDESPTPVASAPTPQVREPSEVGQTRGLANADTTLLQVRKVLAPPDRTAPAGMEWYGVRARTCMHADARPSGGVPWSAWVVVTESGVSYHGGRVDWDDFPPQQYATDGIARGACNVGWVLVSVPRGTFRDVVAVAFRPSSDDALEWTV